METISSALAVREFFSKDSRPTTTQEILELKKSMTVEAFVAFARDCATALGKELRTE